MKESEGVFRFMELCIVCSGWLRKRIVGFLLVYRVCLVCHGSVF